MTHSVEDCINTINEYFGTDYTITYIIPDIGHGKPHVFPKPTIHTLSEILRFVWRIQDC